MGASPESKWGLFVREGEEDIRAEGETFVAASPRKKQKADLSRKTKKEGRIIPLTERSDILIGKGMWRKAS